MVFDFVNVIQGEAKLNQALISDKRVESLAILPASQTRDKDALTKEGVAGIIEELRPGFRLHPLRQPGRHREGRAAGDATSPTRPSW